MNKRKIHKEGTEILVTTKGYQVRNCCDEENALKGRRLLVIEHSMTKLRHLQSVLSGAGYIVEQTKSGMEGLSLLHIQHEKNQPVDLVLFDTELVSRSEEENFLHDMRNDERFKSTPLLLAGKPPTQDELQIFARFNISGYLLKPFKTKDLIMQVKRILLNILCDKNLSNN